MASNYKKLGEYISEVDKRNSDLSLGEDDLFGISVSKEFITTHANLVGVSFDNYKVVNNRNFAYISDTSRRGDKIAISLNDKNKNIIVSSICTVFQINDETKLLPEYLMLWFMRPEFDRYARFMSNGSAREIFDWECMCGVELPVPSIENQRKIVHDYKVITDRIELLRRINENLDSICKTEFKKMIENSKCEKKLLCSLSNVVYGKGLLTTELTDEGYPVYGGNGIIGKYSKYLYDKRMVIISCRGAASGKVMYSEAFSFITSNSLVLEINNSKDYPFEFMLFSCYQTDFISKVSGSAQPQLTVDNLKDVEINIPSNDNIQKFSEFANKCIEQIYLNNKEIDNMEKMQTLILSKLSKEVA